MPRWTRQLCHGSTAAVRSSAPCARRSSSARCDDKQTLDEMQWFSTEVRMPSAYSKASMWKAHLCTKAPTEYIGFKTKMSHISVFHET